MVVVIGAGPAGIMASISAKLHNPNSKVILIEKNNEIGKKLKLTGGGRCNVTANVSNEEVIKNVVKNGKFLYSSLSNFNSNSIIKFFKDRGLTLKEEDHNRMFPTTNKSSDVIDVLYRELVRLKVLIKFNTEVTKVDSKYVYTNENKYDYNAIIIATGGITLPGTGSTGFGHEIAKTFDHTITELVPQEVPLVSNDKGIMDKTLQGLSFNDICLKVYNEKGKIVRSITHDLLFTHFGLSGPAALRASFDVIKLLEKQKEVTIKIDFLPNIHINDLNEDSLKEIPKRLLSHLKEQTTNDNELFELIKAFPISIYTTRGFKQAFVTNGGVKVSEIDPKTMKSKLNPRISFAGEVLDISAYTGGFNITSALSSGYTAGMYCLNQWKVNISKKTKLSYY